jgi:hypothetical protein
MGGVTALVSGLVILLQHSPGRIEDYFVSLHRIVLNFCIPDCMQE